MCREKNTKRNICEVDERKKLNSLLNLDLTNPTNPIQSEGAP